MHKGQKQSKGVDGYSSEQHKWEKSILNVLNVIGTRNHNRQKNKDVTEHKEIQDKIMILQFGVSKVYRAYLTGLRLLTVASGNGYEIGEGFSCKWVKTGLDEVELQRLWSLRH